MIDEDMAEAARRRQATEQLVVAATATQLCEERAVAAYARLSEREEECASLFGPNDPTGAGSRRGAVRAALLSRQDDRARQLVLRYIKESGVTAEAQHALLRVLTETPNEMTISRLAAEKIARAFHESYEEQAPDHGYKTREASAKPWAEVPENNRALMVSVVMDLLASGVIVEGP